LGKLKLKFQFKRPPAVFRQASNGRKNESSITQAKGRRKVPLFYLADCSPSNHSSGTPMATSATCFSSDLTLEARMGFKFAKMDGNHCSQPTQQSANVAGDDFPKVPNALADMLASLGERGIVCQNGHKQKVPITPSTKETLERLQLQSSLNAFDELPPCFEGDAIGSDPSKLGFNPLYYSFVYTLRSPFLPTKPSPKLTKLGEYPKSLLAVHKRRDSTNRLALHLPVSRCILLNRIRSVLIFWMKLYPHIQFPRIAQYCQLHRAKTTIIPDGLNNGWPTTIDFGKVYNYGVQSYHEIYHTLHTMFLDNVNHSSMVASVHPVSPKYLVRKVLVTKGFDFRRLGSSFGGSSRWKTLEDSRAFGSAMFPDNDC
ncbi:hypothetical protein MJO28_013219, partial [Puccinia striiformis f. sp. tritici]